MQQRRVIVTGLGVISPLGCDTKTFWHMLSRGMSGVAPIASFDTSPFSSSLGAEVKDFDPEDFIPRKQMRRMGRATHFAVGSAMMAVRDARLDFDRENRSEVAICMGTSIAGLKEALDTHDSIQRKHYQHTNPFAMTSTFANAVSAEVAIALDVHGNSETYSIGCSSTANALGRAYDLIAAGQTDLVIAGGAEAPLHPSIFSVMEAARTLAPDKGGTITNHPRPFDRTRCGMVLGEGAGCVVLEEFEHARRRGAPMYAELEGWGFTCDAYSMAKPLESGAQQGRAIGQTLASAHWFPEEVDYINACGLGTIDLDAAETSAIKHAFGNQAYRIPISSLKGALGHAFAASGAFQVIGTALALEHQFIPPTLHLTMPDPLCDLDYVALTGRPARIRRALINSFGFGGKNIVLALSHVNALAPHDRLLRTSDWDAIHNQPIGAALARSLRTSLAQWK
jgi:3-oxoacyl-[acyl-carrier-protein] synthase II